MQTDLIAQAEGALAKALTFDEKRAALAAEARHSLAATAERKVDEHLERAVELEAAAFAHEAVAA